MKTNGRPQEIIESIIRRNAEAVEEKRPRDITTIDHIFLEWLWEDFCTLREENASLQKIISVIGEAMTWNRDICARYYWGEIVRLMDADTGEGG